MMNNGAVIPFIFSTPACSIIPQPPLLLFLSSSILFVLPSFITAIVVPLFTTTPPHLASLGADIHQDIGGIITIHYQQRLHLHRPVGILSKPKSYYRGEMPPVVVVVMVVVVVVVIVAVVVVVAEQDEVKSADRVESRVRMSRYTHKGKQCFSEKE